jgi:hypothetical protein
MKFLIGCLVGLLFVSVEASVISGNFSKIENNKKTHIIVIGMADKLGDLFFKSAVTKAKIIMDLYPSEQVIIIATNAEKDLLRNSTFKTIETSSSLLRDSVILSVVEKVSEIASIELFAHSNALEGVILDKKYLSSATLDEKSDLWTSVKKKINPKTYIMIHGCNAAVKTAPMISKIVGVPVIAALTATDFEFVYENNKWAHETEVKTLKKKNDSRVRMKPDNYSYKGHWGDWSEGGFPSYKVFCGDLDVSVCGLGALESLITYPSILYPKLISSKEEFKKNVFDYLCHFSERKDIFNECVSSLEKSLVSNETEFYSPLVGKTLNCSFERCEASFKCNIIQISLNPGSCKLINENDKKSDSFVKEFKFFLEAYDLKTANGSKPLVD